MMHPFDFRPKMSLKRLKRRLSWTIRGRNSSVDEGLSELAEQLTIEENGGIKENGQFVHYYAHLKAGDSKLGVNIYGAVLLPLSLLRGSWPSNLMDVPDNIVFYCAFLTFALLIIWGLDGCKCFLGLFWLSFQFTCTELISVTDILMMMIFVKCSRSFIITFHFQALFLCIDLILNIFLGLFDQILILSAR